MIYASFVNAPDRRYFENRFLRLVPALAFVTLGGGAIAVLAHGISDLQRNFGTYAAWFVAQTTIGQAYNPALFRDVGVGVINGSLWTITAEVLFYFCVPVIVALERRFKYAILVLVVISFAIYVLGPQIFSAPFYRDKTIYSVIELTPIAWGWMFGIGMLAVKHFSWIEKLIKFLPLVLVPMAVLVILDLKGPFGGTGGNRLGLVYFVLYAGMILWLAFGTAYRKLSFDFSYGAYIWHMPVVNLLLVLSVPSVPLALALTVAMAAISWFLVERPALKLKRRSLRPIDEVDGPTAIASETAAAAVGR